MNPIKRLINRFRSDNRGAVVAEVALSAPLYLMLMTGLVEVGNYMTLNLKVQHTVVSISDLVTRDEKISEQVVSDIFQVVPQIMAPYTETEKSLAIISAVSQTADVPASIFWQRVGGGSLDSVSELGAEGTETNLPGITMRDEETVLVTEVFYAYEPLIFTFLKPRIVRRVAYFRPRIGALQEIT